MTKFLLTLISLISLNGLSFAQGGIEGRIVDEENSLPLSGVNVFIENSTLGAATDSDGHFRIGRVPPGTWNLKVSMMGYHIETHTISVEEGRFALLEIGLRKDVLEMNPLVVVASKKEQEILRSPVSVGVIAARELREKGVYAIDAALSYVPGVMFVGNQINIRSGAGFMYGAGGRTLVLIDGIPINASDTGEINWDLIPLVDVERIEVIKGAGSFLYGTNALGGVINVITKKPSQEGKWVFQVSGGVYNDPYYEQWKWTDRVRTFNRQDVSYSRQFGKLDVSVALRRDENLGYMQNRYHHRVIGSTKLVYRPSTDFELTAYASLMRDRRGEYAFWKDQGNVLRAPDGESEVSFRKINQGQFYLSMQHFMSPTFSNRFRISLNEQLLGNHNEKPNEFFPAIGPAFEWSSIWIPSSGHVLTSGVEYKFDRANNFSFGKHNAFTVAPYIQYEFQPSSALSLTGGLRYDTYNLDSRDPENTLSPRIGANYLIKPNWSVRASAGKGFRAPSIVERFLRLSLFGFEVFPNPDLKSERAWTVEVGSRFHVSDSWFGDIAVFQNDYWNLIEPTLDITTNSIQFLNVSRPRIRGVELSSKFSWWQNRVGLEANLTIMDHEDLDTGQYLFYRPRRLAKIIPSVRLERVDVQIEYHYASRVDRVQVFPLDNRVPMHLWKLKAGYKWQNLRVTGEIHNLFNYNYTTRERFLEPIRNVTLGMQVEL
jgi:iron complex outermembrane receptor protein